VTSRNTPPWRAWRPFVTTLALSSLLAVGSAYAQRADQPSLRLEDDNEADAASTPALPRTTADSTAPGKDATNPEGAKSQTQKPKRKRAKLSTGRLPALAPYSKPSRTGLPGGPPAHANAVPSPTVAALPTPAPKRKPKPDGGAFDPTGVMIGDLRLTPAIEEDLGYSSNPNFLAGPTRGSMFETTDVGLGLQSDWSRNDLHANLHGGYADFFSAPQANTPNATGTIGGRLDVSHDLAFDAEGRFLVATQIPGSVSLPTGVVLASTQRPLWETYGATIGGVQNFGDLSLSLHGLVDRTTYQNATLADGSIDDLASDDFTDWGLRGRVAYRISPIVSPFVEGLIDTRRYDETIDSNGYARASDGALAHAGVALALTGQLSGEVSAGYGERHYQDPRLPILAAPLFDASLIWSASPLTKVTLKATSSLSDTTVPAASGAISRVYSIDVSHALRRYLTLGLAASVETDNFVGIAQNDTITNLALKADYNITRDVMLRASVSRQQYVSNVPNSNYLADIFMLGLKLQR
jgi:hypothetical protein